MVKRKKDSSLSFFYTHKTPNITKSVLYIGTQKDCSACSLCSGRESAEVKHKASPFLKIHYLSIEALRL